MELPGLNELNRILERATASNEVVRGQLLYLRGLAVSYRNSYLDTDNLEHLDAAVECFKAAVQMTRKDHPEFADRLQSLGVSFSDRYRRLGDLDDLQNAVLTDRSALALTPRGHPCVPERAENLGHSLVDRYHRLGDLADLEAALQVGKLALNATPEGDTQLPKRLDVVAAQYTKRYQRTGNLEDLDAALSHSKAAVHLAPHDYPDLAEILSGLAMGHTERYHRCGSLEDLDAAVKNDESAVNLTPQGHSKLAHRLSCLAVSLVDRYHQTGTTPDLENALKNAETAASLVPAGHPDQASQQHILGMIYDARYHRWGKPTDLEANLEFMQTAVNLIPSSHTGLQRCLSNLSNSLRRRHNRYGNLEDLQAAIALGTKALNETPASHPDFPRYSEGLALSLLERYRRLGTLMDLESAQDLAHAAVDQTPEGHSNLPGRLEALSAILNEQSSRSGNIKAIEAALTRKLDALSLTLDRDVNLPEQLSSISVSYLSRYERLGNGVDLEAAISNIRDAVNLAPEDSPQLPDYFSQYGACFHKRYKRTGNLKDLEAALTNDEQAMKMTPEDNPALSNRLNSLAVSLAARFSRLGNIEDLESAVRHNSKAIGLTLTGDPHLAQYTHHQGLCLAARYKKFRRQKDLQDAIQNYRVAIDLTSPGHPNLPAFFNNLADVLKDRFLRAGSQADFHESLAKYRSAVELMPEDHPDRPTYLSNLGSTEMDMYHFSRLCFSKHDLELLDIAIKHSYAAVQLSPPEHPDRPIFLQSLSTKLVHRYEELQDPHDMEAALLNYDISLQTYTSNPIGSWKSALEWAALAEIHSPSDVPKAYTAAFNLLPEILWIGNPLKARHEGTRQIKIAKATANALRACIAQGSLPLAVEFLEQGLATTFQQMLQLKTEFDSLPPDDANQLRQLSSILYEQKSADLLAIAAERNSLLLEIRKRPGFEYFLVSKPYQELRWAAKDGPVVILTSHTQGCDAIIIVGPMSDPVHVPLPDVTVAQLEHHKGVLQDILQRRNSRIRQSEASRLFGSREWTMSTPTDECFRDMLSFLGNSVVEVIYNTLELHGVTRGRLWWCLIGAFSGLPLHAATNSDRFIPSYTSTLGSLLGSRSRTPQVPTEIGVVGVTHSESGTASYLTNVQHEVETISSIVRNYPIKTLVGAQATVTAVESQLVGCSWAHLACHGKQDLFDPPKSCLQLYDGSLDLETILKMSLTNAEFVFLAACQTAMGDSELVNESFHLAGGLIAAGFCAAIGTMWSMRDEDGPRVAELVYKHLFAHGRQPRPTDTAEALQLAVKVMREEGLPYERWIPFIHMGV